MSYQPKTYREQGGDKFVVADGGTIEIQSGGILQDDRWSGNVAVAGAALVIPVTHRFVSKTTGGGESLTLANGTPGQHITISLVSDGGDGTLTPATSTGWATVVFAVVGDTIHVEYIDDTVGWILHGAWGTAVALTPLITL